MRELSHVSSHVSDVGREEERGRGVGMESEADVMAEETASSVELCCLMS